MCAEPLPWFALAYDSAFWLWKWKTPTCPCACESLIQIVETLRTWLHIKEDGAGLQMDPAMVLYCEGHQRKKKPVTKVGSVKTEHEYHVRIAWR